MGIRYYYYSYNLVYSPRLKDNVKHYTHILSPRLLQDGCLFCETPLHLCFHSRPSELQHIQKVYVECHSQVQSLAYKQVLAKLAWFTTKARLLTGNLKSEQGRSLLRAIVCFLR